MDKGQLRDFFSWRLGGMQAAEGEGACSVPATRTKYVGEKSNYHCTYQDPFGGGWEPWLAGCPDRLGIFNWLEGKIGGVAA